MPRKNKTKPTEAPAQPKPVKRSYDETVERSHTSDERHSINELVIRHVQSTKNAVRAQWQVFVRPEEHDEPRPDDVFETHEPDEQAAFDVLFKAYAKDDTTTRLELVKDGSDSFVRVWKAKPKKDDVGPNDAFPSVHFDISDDDCDGAGRLVGRLHRLLAGAGSAASRNAHDDTSNAVPRHVDLTDCGELFDFVGEIAKLVSAELLPGDPGRTYPIDERLSSIFRAIKGLGK